MIVILLIDLIVVVTLLIASRRCLEAAVPLVCFYLVLLPHESRLVIPGLFDLTSERVAVLTVLVLSLIRGGQKNRNPIPMRQLIYLHIGWAVCSTLFSISVATSAKQLIGEVVEFYLLYYVLFRNVSDVRTIFKSLYAMMMAMGLCCVFGMFEAYGSWSILNIFPSNLWITYGRTDPLYIEWGRGLRVRSTFPHPILFGDALAMSIPIALYLLSVWKARGQRIALFVALLLMFWGIYKTSSRGPWITAGISCTLMFFMIANQVRKYLVVIAVLSATVLIVRPGILQTIENLYESTQDASSPVGSSFEYRHALTDAIRHAVAANTTRTIFGYGMGTFRERGLDITFLDRVQHWYTCDNNWAKFLYETGYGGLLIIGALLMSPLVMTLKSYKKLSGSQRHLSGVIFIVLAGFYLSLWSVAGYDWGQQGFMAWILISLSVVYPKIVLTDRKHHLSRAPLHTVSPMPRVAGSLQYS
jgi:hypothetical protein